MILGALLICLGVSHGALHLRFASDFRVFLGADSPDFIANEQAQGPFGRADNVAFLLISQGGEVFATDTLSVTQVLTEAA